MTVKTHQDIAFRPIEETETTEIARRQTEDSCELSDFLGNKPNWAPMTISQIKEKLAEEMKKPHTAVFSIYCGEQFVGIGEWSASWDTWSPHAWFIVWPEFRRHGFGTAIAGKLLDRCFLDNPGHHLSAAAAEWNEPAKAFIIGMGFKDIGRMRQAGMADGKYYDILFFDILKSEYLAGRKGAKE